MSAAGYGAEEQASRRARRAARLRQETEAAGAVDAEVSGQLERAQRTQRNWSAGAEGERLVARSLEALGRYGWTALHDVRWPGRQQANIDHIAIGPGGVAVIDAKNWSGNVAVAGGTLRQNGYSRAREAESAATAAAEVAALLAPQHRTAVFAVICLAGQDQEPVPVGPGVTAVGRHQVAAHLAQRDPRLSPYDVADIGRYLATELQRPPARSTNRRGSRRGRAPTATQRNSAGSASERPGSTTVRRSTAVRTLGWFAALATTWLVVASCLARLG